MSIAINLAWWHIPTIVTVATFLWAFFWPVKDTGYFGDAMSRIFMFGAGMCWIALAWAIAGFFKGAA